MDVREVRRQNLICLVADAESRKTYALKLGYKDSNYLSQLLKGFCVIGDKTARKVEVAENLALGWLDESHTALWSKTRYVDLLDRQVLLSMNDQELQAAFNLVSVVFHERFTDRIQAQR